MTHPFDYQDNLNRTLERTIAIFDVLAVFRSSELAEEIVEPLADLGRELLHAAQKETKEAFSREHDARLAAMPAPKPVVFRSVSEMKKITAAARAVAKKLDGKKKAKKRAA